MIEFVSIILIAWSGCIYIHNKAASLSVMLNINNNFLWRALCNNFLLLLSLFCIVILANNFKKTYASYAGYLLLGISLSSTVLFDTIFNNPFFNTIAIGDTIIFNGLLFAYALPALWFGLFASQLSNAMRTQLNFNCYPGIIVFILMFTWITLNITQIFHGAIICNQMASNAEIYTYSLTWLALSLILLFIGVTFKHKMARLSSLALIILTVTKVFLYDAAALNGILRVMSFLGLGLALIAISWFYAKFVFDKPTN